MNKILFLYIIGGRSEKGPSIESAGFVNFTGRGSLFFRGAGRASLVASAKSKNALGGQGHLECAYVGHCLVLQNGLSRGPHW